MKKISLIALLVGVGSLQAGDHKDKAEEAHGEAANCVAIHRSPGSGDNEIVGKYGRDLLKRQEVVTTFKKVAEMGKKHPQDVFSLISLLRTEGASYNPMLNAGQARLAESKLYDGVVTIEGLRERRNPSLLCLLREGVRIQEVEDEPGRLNVRIRYPRERFERGKKPNQFAPALLLDGVKLEPYAGTFAAKAMVGSCAGHRDTDVATQQVVAVRAGYDALRAADKDFNIVFNKILREEFNHPQGHFNRDGNSSDGFWKKPHTITSNFAEFLVTKSLAEYADDQEAEGNRQVVIHDSTLLILENCFREDIKLILRTGPKDTSEAGDGEEY